MESPAGHDSSRIADHAGQYLSPSWSRSARLRQYFIYQARLKLFHLPPKAADHPEDHANGIARDGTGVNGAYALFYPVPASLSSLILIMTVRRRQSPIRSPARLSQVGHPAIRFAARFVTAVRDSRHCSRPFGNGNTTPVFQYFDTNL